MRADRHPERVLNQETYLLAERQVDGISFRQIAVSCRRSSHHQSSLTVGGISEAGFQIRLSQVGKVFEYLILRHVRGKIFEDFIYCDSESANAWFAAAFIGFNGDVVSIVHTGRILEAKDFVKLLFFPCQPMLPSPMIAILRGDLGGFQNGIFNKREF